MQVRVLNAVRSEAQLSTVQKQYNCVSSSEMYSEAWGRLKTKFSGLFDRVDARSPPPDAPEELKKWAWDTSAVVTMVMAYCGFIEYQRIQAEPIVVPRELPPAMHDMYLRNAQSGRTAKIASRALMGGWYALAFGGMFYGIDAVSAIARDSQDVANSSLAGLVTGSIYGALIPGTLQFRASRSVFGAAVGVAAGSVVGYLTYNLTDQLEAGQKPSDTSSSKSKQSEIVQ